jgi:predicted HTH domain antitoxin
MSTLQLDLDEHLVELLRQSDQPLERTALELIVLELYRRRTISSGKAAQLLEMPRGDFIVYASGLGIPYLDLTKEELEEEVRASEAL